MAASYLCSDTVAALDLISVKGVGSFIDNNCILCGVSVIASPVIIIHVIRYLICSMHLVSVLVNRGYDCGAVAGTKCHEHRLAKHKVLQGIQSVNQLTRFSLLGSDKHTWMTIHVEK